MNALESQHVHLSDNAIQAGISRGRVLRSAAFHAAGVALVRWIASGFRQSAIMPRAAVKGDCTA